MLFKITILTICVAFVCSDSFEEDLKRLARAAEMPESMMGESTGSLLLPDEKAQLLELHNDSRNQVTPPAQNMPALTWSKELAGVAQNFTNDCTLSSNPNRGANVGENMFANAYSGGPEPLQSAVNQWTAEKANYVFSSNTCNGECVHYKQVVSATTTKFGCGYKLCHTLTNAPGEGNNWNLLICYYQPKVDANARPYTEQTNSEL